MTKTFTRLLILYLCLLCPLLLQAQQNDRFQPIQQNLDKLASDVPGLKQKVQLSISGLPIQEYLNALARANSISISTDPAISITVNDILTNVTAENVLLYLAQKYNLDIKIVGTIIMISAYQDPRQFLPPPVRQIDASYNAQANTLSFSLNNDSLSAVARKITAVSNHNVVVPASMQGKKVTAFIQHAPFETALEKLAYANEIKMVHTSDNYYLFQPLGDGEELYINGENKTSARKTYRPVNGSLQGSAGMSARIVNGQKLVSADANNTPVLDLLQQACQELNVNYSIYSEIRGTIKLRVKDLPFDDFLNLLFKGTEYTFHNDNGVYLFGDRKIEGLRTFKAIHLQHRSIDTVLTMIPNNWKAAVEIKEFREQNTLLLSGSASQIAEIENVINQLDALVPVVMIEVTLIDIHNTRSISTGISAGTADSVKTGGTLLSGLNYTFGSKSINSFLNSLSPVNLGHVTPNFYVTLRALETKDNVDVRSTPKLTALNGHTATLSIGNSVYYKNTAQNTIPFATSAQSIFTNTYVESKADLSIAIKPEIAGDDQVTLGINVNISSFTSIPTDGSPPPMSTSKFASSIRVNNEDMIVLGGIERTEKDESASGIPLLSRIPVLKWLFSSRTKTNGKVVTLVFIKPTILR